MNIINDYIELANAKFLEDKSNLYITRRFVEEYTKRMLENCIFIENINGYFYYEGLKFKIINVNHK